MITWQLFSALECTSLNTCIGIGIVIGILSFFCDNYVDVDVIVSIMVDTAK